MKTTVVMDESGNTQQTIAVGLVSIPGKIIPEVNSIFSIEESDPNEIKVLYEKRSGGEFKYADLRNAFRQTQLPIYDEYLKNKLVEINKLKVQFYLSVFPNPNENAERLRRLIRESEDLLHKWAHQNRDAAMSRELEILVDQQIFPEPYLFEYYLRRGQWHCELFPKRLVKEGQTKSIPADRSNTVDIRDVNSKTIKTIQLTDFIVGCAREHFARGVDDYFKLIPGLVKKEHNRVQIKEYTPAKRGFIGGQKLGKW